MYRRRLTALLEGVHIALDALRANRARAALTILGVAVGVFVVVVMAAAIHGINVGIATQLDRAGPTTFVLNRYPVTFEACDGSSDTCRWRSNPPITVAEMAAIARVPTIRGVVARTGMTLPTKHRDRELAAASVVGFGAAWPDVGGGDLYAGRAFTESEDLAAARVAVINDQMAERVFGEGDPLGKTITIGRLPFEVIGLYHDPSSLFGQGETPRAIVPYLSAVRHLGARAERLTVSVKPRSDVSRDEAIDDVTALLRGARRLRPGAENTFAIITQDQLFDTWNRLTGVFFLVMLTLSGIGLAVGGVGVVGIMMISVTERTREIGVRKALGATRGIILWQFLIEAATLTATGAAVGLVVGWLVALGVRRLSPVPASVPPLAIVVALLASVLTGVCFGLYPATKAARLDPIDALRYE